MISNQHKSRWTAFLSLLGLVLLAGPSRAQNADDKDLAFWSKSAVAKPAAAAELVLARDPLTVVILRDHGQRFSVWGNELAFAGTEAPPLNEARLQALKDGIAYQSLHKHKNFHAVFVEAVVNADRVPLDAFAESAKENSHVTVGHMRSEPWKYRGKVIPVEGRLIRLRKLDAPQELQDQGIKYLYEGWVSGPTAGSNPVRIIMPNPNGLEPAESMKRSVTFYGYFITWFKYSPAKGKDLDTVFLVGPTVVLRPAPPQTENTEGTTLTSIILYGIVGVVVVVTALMIGLTYFFRKGDARIKAKLEQIQASRTAEMLEKAGPDAFFDNAEPKVEGNGFKPE